MEKKEGYELQTQIDSMIISGAEFLYPQKIEKWKEFVRENTKDYSSGRLIEGAIEIMKILDEKSIEDAINYYDEWLEYTSPGTKRAVSETVLYFSKIGPEFIEKFNYIPEYLKDLIPVLKEMKEYNRKLEEENKKLGESSKTSKTPADSTDDGRD